MSIVISNRNFIINQNEQKLKDESIDKIIINYEKKPILKPKIQEKPIKKYKYFLPEFYI